MSKFISLAAAGLISASALPAFASDDVRCRVDAGAVRMSAQDISAKVSAMGYTVREVEHEDGCYEVKGSDKNGARVELKLHPVTGEIVKSERKS